MIALLVLMLAACAVPGVADEPGEEWPERVWRPLYDGAVHDAVTRRLLMGYPDWTMQPTREATRYEWAAVLSRMVWYYDLDLPYREILPRDVPWDHWSADALRVLGASGVHPMTPDMAFGGNRPLTRADFAVTCRGMMLALQGQDPLRWLRDVPPAHAHAAGVLVEEGLLTPYGDGELHLDRSVPRWQIAVTVSRLVAWNRQQGGPEARGPIIRAAMRRGR